MIKLLLGGSPCTFWSIAQINNRETTAEGVGWKLFQNYRIAKEKFQPDFFIYENNKSAAQAIKDQIKKELNVGNGTTRYTEINSALVSAQNRQRFYVHNCGEVEQPADRNITLRDVLELALPSGNEGNHIPVMRVREATKKGYTEIEGGYCVDLTHPNSKTRRGRNMKDKCNCLTKQNQYYQYCGTIEHPICKFEDGCVTVGDKLYPAKIIAGQYIVRPLTVTECARLQTMPDDYCRAVSDHQAYKALGNGWTAEVIIHILNGALKDVPKDEEIVVLSMYDGIATGRYCLDKMGFTNVTYYAYEIDKYAKQIAMSNYPDIIQKGDAFDVRRSDWTIDSTLAAS